MKWIKFHKKIFVIILSTIMGLSLISCGTSSNNSSSYNMNISQTASTESGLAAEDAFKEAACGSNGDEVFTEENATGTTSMQREDIVLESDPFAIEQMLFDYFNNGGSLDTEALRAVTGLRIYGSNLISVVCGSSVGSDKTAVIEYNVTNKETTAIYSYETNERGQVVRVDYPIGNIDNILFLKYCPNLVELEIYCNMISDISPVTDLSNLTTLMLKYNQIVDISPIAGLSGLIYVHFDGNDISDISCLARLTNLVGAGMDYNRISDVSSLANLSKLQYLYLTNNQITDISSIEGLSELKDFHIRNNYVSEQDIHSFDLSHPKCFVY